MTMELRRIVPDRADAAGFVRQRFDGAGSGFLGNNLAFAQDINGRAVGAGGFAGGLTGASECAANHGRKSFCVVFSVLGFHELVSSNFGRSPELSYTAHASACNR